MSAIEQALEMHEKWNGKIETTAKAHVNTREDLQLHIHRGLQNLARLSQKTRMQPTSIP